MIHVINTKILLSMAVIIAAAAVIVGATFAFFADTETSSANTFAAGELDLKVDSQSHYAGLICSEISAGVYHWIDDPLVVAPTTRPDLLNQDCNGTWTQTDLGPTNTFFNFSDLKPGDQGENTISLHVNTNDAYVCAVIDNLVDNDNGVTEPEGEDGDLTPGPLGGGELSSQVNFFAWGDTDGDNVWDNGELPLFADPFFGPASDVLGGVSYPLFTPQNGPLAGNTTTYVGLSWCFGNMTVDTVNELLTCDGGPVNNLTQTDSMTADISFYAEQARNNPDFTCPEPGSLNPVDQVDQQ